MELLLVIMAICVVSAHDLWSLTGRTGPGPEDWGDTFPECNGQRQSPIDVPADTDTVYDSKLTPFNFVGYDTLGADDMVISNNGYSAQVVIKDSSIGNAFFTGGGYSGRYLASRLHFHWGPNDSSGSDHSFEGKFYPAELDEEDNPDLEPYIEALESVKYEGDSAPFNMSFDKFMPDDTSKFYQYNGSMPLPPCKEVVVWTLFKKTQKISSAQLAKLRQLFDTAENATDPHPHEIDGNQRGTQPLYGRTVRRSFHLDDDDDSDGDGEGDDDGDSDGDGDGDDDGDSDSHSESSDDVDK